MLFFCWSVKKHHAFFCSQHFHSQILCHVIHPLLKVSLSLTKGFFIGQEVGHKLISLLVHHSSVVNRQWINVCGSTLLFLDFECGALLFSGDLIMAWDIISTPAGADISLGAGSESKMTWAHGLIHIWGNRMHEESLFKSANEVFA